MHKYYQCAIDANDVR